MSEYKDNILYLLSKKRYATLAEIFYMKSIPEKGRIHIYASFKRKCEEDGVWKPMRDALNEVAKRTNRKVVIY